MYGRKISNYQRAQKPFSVGGLLPCVFHYGHACGYALIAAARHYDYRLVAAAHARVAARRGDGFES